MVTAIGTPAGYPTDYPEQRIFLESQGWWLPTDTNVTPASGGVEPGQHIHMGAAWPYLQTLKGTMHLDLRIILHSQPSASYVNFLRIGTAASTNFLIVNKVIKPDASGNAELIVPVDVNTAGLHDGINEFRLTANMSTRPDGARQYQSTGWLVRLANGNTTLDDRSSTWGIEARGWYSGVAYTNARLTSGFSWTPRSGTWTFGVRLGPGSGGGAVTGHMVTIDPNFHAGSNGTIVHQSSGPYTGNVSINTTTLTNGVHKLVMRSDANWTGTPVTGRNSGVMVIPFVVQN